MLMNMELWMTKTAFLLCSADIAGVFQMLYQGEQDHEHLRIQIILSIVFILASLSSSIMSKWLNENHISAARICGHVSLLIALVVATLLLSLSFNGSFRWLPLVACAVPLFLLFSELHKVFCSTSEGPNTPSGNGEATSVANDMETGLALLHLDSPISNHAQLSSSSSNHVELTLGLVETNLVEPQPAKFNWVSWIFCIFHWISAANFNWVSWIFCIFHWISVLYLLRHLHQRGFIAVAEDSSNHVSPYTSQPSPATDIEVAGSLTGA